LYLPNVVLSSYLCNNLLGMFKNGDCKFKVKGIWVIVVAYG